MTTDTLLALAALLFVKHLIADGPLQTDAQAANKKHWLHPDGLAHSGTHVAGTALCLAICSALFGVDLSIAVIVGILLGEFIVHYLIDFGKCQLDALGNWAEKITDAEGRSVLQIRHKNFFFLFLADQTMHSLTYVAMLYALSAG